MNFFVRQPALVIMQFYILSAELNVGVLQYHPKVKCARTGWALPTQHM